MTDTPPERQFPFIVDGAPLVLITGEELAAAMLYKEVCSAFRAWLKKLGIIAVPGRNNVYDPKHVRARLDASHMTGTPATEPENNLSHTQKRRARRGR